MATPITLTSTKTGKQPEVARPRSRSRLGLAAAGLVALGYASLATVLGLDRAAANEPDRYDWLPAASQQTALATRARQLTLGGQAAQALPLAERLVRRDPFWPHGAGLLGTARLAIGDNRGAISAYRTSARLGWRDGATQVYWFEDAMRRGDIDLAVVRFRAIAQQWWNAPAIDRLAGQLENNPGGKAALAARIARGDKWAIPYATPDVGQPVSRLASGADVLIAAAALGAQLGCDAVASMVDTLIPPEGALAGKLWSAHCRRAPRAGQLADAGFEAQPIAGQLTGFDWQFPGDGALDAAVSESGEGGKVLQLQSVAASTLPVAAQRLVLEPGSYQVSWLEPGGAPSRISASLSCTADRTAADPQDGQGKGPRRSTVVQAGNGCEAPLLQLWLKPGSGPVTIDNVAVERR